MWQRLTYKGPNALTVHAPTMYYHSSHFRCKRKKDQPSSSIRIKIKNWLQLSPQASNTPIQASFVQPSFNKKSATPIGPEPFAKRTRLFTHSLKSPWSSLSPSPSSSKYPSSSLAIPLVSPQSPASDHPAPPTHHCGNHL